MTSQANRRDVRGRARLSGSSGFTLIEMMVSLSLLLVVTGGIFMLVGTAQRGLRTQPEIAEMQQRLRIVADRIYRDLLMAGAGMDRGAGRGALIQYVPAVRPARRGLDKPDGPLAAASDRISILYVPQTRAQASLAVDMSSPASDLQIDTAVPGCTAGPGPCGFAAGMPVLLFDAGGIGSGYEVFRVSGTGTSSLQHAAPNPTFSKAYLQGTSQLAEVERHVYYLDANTNRLMHYDGDATDEPLVDNVAGLTFTYFVDPDPTSVPPPPPGLASCVYDAGAPPKPLLADLGGEALQPVTLAQLSDGPVCGTGANQFDGDLLRVRKIRVAIRVQVEAEDLRGSDTQHFATQGQSTDARRQVPDYEMRFDVSPRNLNLIR